MISASNSNWLDRLRSSRGFPTGEEPDLDRFLSSSSSSGSAPTPNDSTTHSGSTQSQPPLPTRSWPPPPPPPPSHREFNGVLCDLFNMGGGETSRTFSLKTSRKQPNPKFCKVSSNSNSNSDFLLPSTSNDSRREKIDKGGSISNNNGDNDLAIRVDEELRGCGGGGDEKDELKAYTRSEVTVIDTSFENWKCDKWVFRKNDEWKIKDKKSKSRGYCGTGKKRKVLVSKLGGGNSNKLNDGNGNENDQSKLKMKKKKRKREVENLLMNQNKESPQNVKEREPCNKEKEGFLSKLPHKRFPCPRPPEKFRTESSPVVLLKSIPPNNVNTTIKPGKTFQKKPRKQMKIV